MIFDREDFIRRILETPGDDTPRLAFADWLGETGDEGDADRAAFIRLGIKYAQIGPQPPTLELVNQAIGIRQCEDALESRYGHSWLAAGACPDCHGSRALPRSAAAGTGTRGCDTCRGIGAACWPLLERYPFASNPNHPYIRSHFGRGFLGRIELTAVQFTPDVAAAIFRWHPVEEVVLTDRHPSAWPNPTGFFWHDDRRQGGIHRGACYIPAAVYDLIDWTFDLTTEPPTSSLRTLTEAHAALSVAGVAYGRKAAGLTAPSDIPAQPAG